ncbi:MAG: hypothetical protein AB7W59_04505, partial [Acidimicrobiia bacterium]
LPFSVRRQGSLLQCFCSVEEPAANATRSDADLATALHLAALNEGVFFAARGLLALNTVLDEALVDEAADRIGAAMGAVMAEQPVAVD